MHKSGGLTLRNPRQGYRAEYIAEYIFSAFGTSIIATQGNDVGIDLLCNLTAFEGHYILVKSSYGVQVKSLGYPFEYFGAHATTWLRNLEFPLLLANVDKEKSNIKIYSAWNLNRYLLAFNSDDPDQYPERITFNPSDEDELKEPNIRTGEIPIGKPILDFNLQDVGIEENWRTFYNILDEWLTMDNKNYLLRRAGISCAFGYIKWYTNKSLEESLRKWYKPYFYSPYHTENAKHTIAEAYIVLGLYYKNSFEASKNPSFKVEFNNMRLYVQNHLISYMEDFGRKLFQNEI